MNKIEINLNDNKIISLIWAVNPIQKLIISKTIIKADWLDENDFILESSWKSDNKIKLSLLWNDYFEVNTLLNKIKTVYIKKLNDKYNKRWITFISKY